MLYVSGGVLVCLEYPSKHSKLHQGLDWIINTLLYWLWLYYSSFENVSVWMFSLYVNGIWR